MAGGETLATSATKLDALRIQSSTYGGTVPLVYGVARIQGNLLWYGDFAARARTEHSGDGKGGAGGTSKTTYTYFASPLMGLAEGHAIGVATVWRGKDRYIGGITSGAIIYATTTRPITPPTGDTFTLPLAPGKMFAGVIRATTTTGGGDGTKPMVLANGLDYSVSAGGLISVRPHSAGIGAAITYHYCTIPSASTQGALIGIGLGLSRGALGQSIWPHLSANHPTQAISYSGITYVYGTGYQLGDQADLANHNFELQGKMAYHTNPSRPDADPAYIALDILLDNRYGAGFPARRVQIPESWSNYCVANNILLSVSITEQSSASEIIQKICKLTNTAPVWSGGVLRFIPYGDRAIAANGRLYVPSITVLYDLGDGDYLDLDTPIKVSRKAQSDAHNHIRVEYHDRYNDYNISIAEAKDQAGIDVYGVRSADILQAHWAKTEEAARAISQFTLQRSVNIRATYEMRLPINYCLLAPMDIVTITDAGLGLDKYAIRIVSVDEGDGDITIVAEDFPLGAATETKYQSQSSNGYMPDYNVQPGDAAVPAIFETPGVFSASGLQIAIATSGGVDWGGCDVWGAWDGVNYTRLGRLSGPSRHGICTGATSGGILPVQLLSGDIGNSTAATADALGTLCYVGGASPEFLAYEGATLTGPGAYNVSGLRRGQYGTSPTAVHTNGDLFVRMDQSILLSDPLDPDLVGSTIAIKLLSYNIFGGGQQSLAQVPAYNYTITGQYIGATQFSQSDLIIIPNGGVSITGNTITKSGGSSAWDAGAYTQQGFTGGCTLSARCLVGDAMVGLSLIPTAANGFGDLAYAIRFVSGGWQIWEGGAYTSINGLSAVGFVATITYSGASVIYMIDGLTVRVVDATKGLRYYFDTSIYTPGGIISAVSYAPYSSNDWADISGPGKPADNATSDLRIVNAAGTKIIGNAIEKISPSVSLFDASAYSRDAHINGAFVSFFVTSVNKGLFCGLSIDPTIGVGYTSINYAWHCAAGGGTVAVIYELGEPVTGIIPIIAGDMLDIKYDGAYVVYAINGLVVRQTPAPGGLKLSMDTSFAVLGAKISGIKFGPLSKVADIGAGQVLPVARGSAINDDPDMRDISVWEVVGDCRSIDISDGKHGRSAIRCTGPGPNSINSRRFPVSQGKIYRLSAWARRLSGPGVDYLRIIYRDAVGTQLSFVISPSFEGQVFSPGWTRYQGLAQVPGGAVTAELSCVVNFPGNSGVVDIQDFRLEEIVETNLIAQNAATEVFQVQAAGPIQVIKQSGIPNGYNRFTPILSLSIPIVSNIYTFDILVSVTFDYQLTYTGGLPASGYIRALLGDDAVFDPFDVSTVAYTQDNSQRSGSCSLEGRFTLPAGAIKTYSLHAQILNPPALDLAYISRARIRAEIIKR
jgi:Putative phage tail protein